MTFNLDRYKYLIRICALNQYMHDDDQEALQKMEGELERILKAFDEIAKKYSSNLKYMEIFYDVASIIFPFRGK